MFDRETIRELVDLQFDLIELGHYVDVSISDVCVHVYIMRGEFDYKKTPDINVSMYRSDLFESNKSEMQDILTYMKSLKLES